MKNIDYTEIIQAIVALTSVLITSFVIPFLKEKLSKEKYEKLKMWVSVGVKAAEQLIKGSGKGEEKKQYVMNFLRSKGITFNVDEVSALIESEVYKLTQGSGYIFATPESPTGETATAENYNITADTENTVEAVG